MLDGATFSLVWAASKSAEADLVNRLTAATAMLRIFCLDTIVSEELRLAVQTLCFFLANLVEQVRKTSSRAMNTLCSTYSGPLAFSGQYLARNAHSASERPRGTYSRSSEWRGVSALTGSGV